MRFVGATIVKPNDDCPNIEGYKEYSDKFWSGFYCSGCMYLVEREINNDDKHHVAFICLKDAMFPDVMYKDYEEDIHETK
jgi:hypothetical protein